MSEPARAGFAPTLAAWAVHLLTASGVVITLLAIAALARGRYDECLLWLVLALLIDGVDGTLARAAQVKQRLPRIDGEALDLIVDYLNYVLVPTLFLWRSGLLAAGLELVLAALIQLSSLYVFVRRDMKTEDGYFRGFPALWNVVALYFHVTSPDPAVGAAIIVALAAASFAPILFVHPFRVRDYGAWLLPLAAVWAASTAALLWAPLRDLGGEALLACSLATGLLLVVLGLIRTGRGPRPSPASGALR